MVLCPNKHDNLEGLSHCRICQLPLLDLRERLVFLSVNLASRAKMGRPPPHVLNVGLGSMGAALIDVVRSDYGDSTPGRTYLAIDATEATSQVRSTDLLCLKLGGSTSGSGTFCGIGELLTERDPSLVPALREAGLSHHDRGQVVFIMAGVGGGIGSAASILVEKCQQLNPGCYTVGLIVIPGADESFHNHLNAFYGLSRLLETETKKGADLIITASYDRMKKLRGVGIGGEELRTEGLLAALSDLLTRSLSAQRIAEIIRINRSMDVKLVVPCLAMGRSLEIFGSLSNVLESAIVYPANRVSDRAVLVCHLLLRVPDSQATSFREEAANEGFLALIKRHFPAVRGSSLSIIRSDAQHDRIDACILLGGDSATSALFSDDARLARFEDELSKQTGWQSYGLSDEGVRSARDRVMKYDSTLERVRGEGREKAEEATNTAGKDSLKVPRRVQTKRRAPQ